MNTPHVLAGHVTTHSLAQDIVQLRVRSLRTASGVTDKHVFSVPARPSPAQPGLCEVEVNAQRRVHQSSAGYDQDYNSRSLSAANLLAGPDLNPVYLHVAG